MTLAQTLVGSGLLALALAAHGDELGCPDSASEQAAATITVANTSTNTDCVTVGQWQLGLAIGYGQRSNPLRDGDAIPLLLIPRLSYYGDRFFLENLELGYTLADNSALMVNLIATPGYDRMFFSRWDPNNIFVNLEGTAVTPGAGVTSIALAGLEKRRLAYLAGIELSGGTDQFDWQLQLLSDVSGVHDGEEARLAASIVTEAGAWRLSSGLGLTWKSSALVNYYYGIQAQEVSDGRSLYSGRSTWNPFLKFSATRPLDERWQLRLHWHYETLGKGISDSPIVAEHYVSTLFVGGDYHF